MVKDQIWDRRRKGQVSHKQFTTSSPSNNKLKSQFRTFPNICDSDNVQVKKKRIRNVNGKVGAGTIGHNFLLRLHPGGRHTNGKNGKKKYRISVVLMVDIFKNERIISDFYKEFRLQAVAIPS